MHQRSEAGFTLLELLVVVAVIGIIAVIAIPGLLRARIAGNEASAISTLRAVNSAQLTYAATCGGGFFASDLTILGDPAPTGAAFISPDLSASATVEKGGYRLNMTKGDEALGSPQDGCNPSGVAAALFSSYYASNQPVSTASGSRWLWTNSLGTLYFSVLDEFDGETLGNSPPTVGAPLQ